MDNLILVDIVQSQFRAHSHDDVKLKGLSGSCIFAYEFYPIIGSSDLDSAKRPEAQQTLSDIQRGALSCEFFKIFNRIFIFEVPTKGFMLFI